MFFLQATQAPVVVTIVHGENSEKRTTLSVPKLSLEDLIGWAAALSAAKAEKLTSELDEARKREFHTYYGNLDYDINDLVKAVRTPEGVKSILRSCLPTATHVGGDKVEITQEWIDTLYTKNGLGRLFPLAWELADLQDTARTDPNPPKMSATSEDHTDPLTSGGKSA